MINYSLGLYEKSMPHSMSISEKLFKTKASGFDFLEVSIDETDEKLERLCCGSQKRKEVIIAVQDSGVTIGSMCLSGHRKYPLGSHDEHVRSRSLDIMERAIELACVWGIRIVQLAGYDVYYEQGDDRSKAFFTENLRKSVELASKSGVTLAFETMETPFMDTVEKAMHFVMEINSPYLQIYPDLGNLTNAALLYGHTVESDIKKGAGHIVALHLKETAPGIYRDVPYGTGHSAFVEGIASVRSLGVNRFVGEFWDNGAFEKQLIHAHTFLRGLLE